MAIMIKTPQEIEKMRRSGAVVRDVLEHVKAHVKPGVTTLDLESCGGKQDSGVGSYLRIQGLPRLSLCSVHFGERAGGAWHPLQRACAAGRRYCLHRLRSGAGRLLRRLRNYGSCGSRVAPKTKRLLDVTKASLETAIKVVRPGATLGDIGAAVQEVVEADGFSVVREFVGHGIGTRMHEDPQVPNYGQRGRGPSCARDGPGHRAHGECRASRVCRY